MQPVKIYTSSHRILKRVAEDRNLKLDLIKEGFATGYVAFTDTLRPFCCNSEVDGSETIVDITSEYITPPFVL